MHQYICNAQIISCYVALVWTDRHDFEHSQLKRNMKLTPIQSFKDSGFITRPTSVFLKGATDPQLCSLSQNSLGYVSKCHNMEQKKDNTKHVFGS
jgi:hypothetical protein